MTDGKRPLAAMGVIIASNFHGVDSVSFPELTTSSATAEIAPVGGHYAVQGHSRSLIFS